MTHSPLRVACIGECMMELRTRPDGLLEQGFGGDTLNTAVYLARLGIPVHYATALGRDEFSEAMVAAWAEEGIDTSLVLRIEGQVPGLYLIQTDASGERRFHYWRDSAPVRQLFTYPQTAGLVERLSKFDVVYLSGITLSLFRQSGLEQLFSLLESVGQNGGRVVFDTNFRPRGWPDKAEAQEVFFRAISLSHTVLAGVEDFMQFDGDDDARSIAGRILAAGAQEAVVKLASPDCIAAFDGKFAVVEGNRVVPVDTTAAGDSFAAGYLAGRLMGEAPLEAARSGHRLAGRVVLHPGAIIPRDAMPGTAG